MVQHRKRPKMVCLSDEEYKALVQARGKYEYETGQKTSGFGDLVKLLALLYIGGKFLESLSQQQSGRPRKNTR